MEMERCIPTSKLQLQKWAQGQSSVATAVESKHAGLMWGPLETSLSVRTKLKRFKVQLLNQPSQSKMPSTVEPPRTIRTLASTDHLRLRRPRLLALIGWQQTGSCNLKTAFHLQKEKFAPDNSFSPFATRQQLFETERSPTFSKSRFDSHRNNQ